MPFYPLNRKALDNVRVLDILQFQGHTVLLCIANKIRHDFANLTVSLSRTPG